MGTIIELLLPSNQLKKYVHFVFGLLFLLLLAQPIFYIFKTDITEHISFIEEQMQADEGEVNRTKNNIEKQKEDIQAEQAAYIWNELAEHYMTEANATLEDEYKVQINDITFKQNENHNDEELIFNTFIVSLQSPTEDEGLIPAIKPIEINREQKEITKVNQDTVDAIEQTLRTIWQLEEEIILELRWEGGRLD